MRLHKQFNLNPTIPTCFICGKPKAEIALLGAAYKDEAPMYACLDKEPCTECKELSKKGVVLISIRDGETGSDPYRSGEIIVIQDEAFIRVFGEITSRFGYIEDSVLKRIKGTIPKTRLLMLSRLIIASILRACKMII
ncbi:MAG: hypothetical protein NTU66_05995 [Elusimicrobia bacterium]|nr:hypothetical protein [Elusimicrobiota bacterium]